MSKLSRVRFERLRRGIKQKDLARDANLNQAVVSLVESGRLTPTPRIRQAIAKVLGLPQERLFGADGRVLMLRR